MIIRLPSASLIVLLALFSPGALAAGGGLDATFGNKGVTTTAIGTNGSHANQVIQQADGKLVAAGDSYTSIDGSGHDFALARYNTDGSLDITFDGDGKLTTAVGTGSSYANSVIQQTDGKLVAAGCSYCGYNDGINDNIALVRYNPDGSLDTTFDGDGIVETSIGASGSDARSVLQQADGKLVAAGSSDGGLTLVRYNLDGSLDATFGAGGKQLSGRSENAYSVIQQADGKLVVAGSSHYPYYDYFLLMRFNADGSLDALFGENGRVETSIADYDRAYSVIQQADGKLVIAGSVFDLSASTIFNFALVRYNSDGSLDTTFDGDGIVRTIADSSVNDARSLLQQADGKLVALTGSGLIRYYANGSLDNAFSGNGLAETGLDDAYALAQQADGKLVTAGSRSNGSNSDFALARFKSGLSVGNQKNRAAVSVAFAGDVNNDGFGDYVVGASGYDIPATASKKTIMNAGRAEVISGKSGELLMSINGISANDAMGFSLAGNGDIDGDGFADVIVGAPKADNTKKKLHAAGTVTILFGPDGQRREVISGTSPNALAGYAVALGDVNGDGHADIVIGAPKDDNTNKNINNTGSVSVISGSDFSLIEKFFGTTMNSQTGASVALGDIDGDGNNDIIYGAPLEDGDKFLPRIPANETMTFAGMSGSGDSMQDYDPENTTIKDTGFIAAYDAKGKYIYSNYGSVANARAGQSVAAADINNDGLSEIIIGSPGDRKGKIKRYGSVSVISVTGASSTLLLKRFGATAEAGLGNSVAAGDVNGDGYADIIVGAWKDDAQVIPTFIKDAGSVSIWSGSDHNLMTTHYGNAIENHFGFAVGIGDMNNDGFDDLLIGIRGYQAPGAKLLRDIGVTKLLSGTK